MHVAFGRAIEADQVQHAPREARDEIATNYIMTVVADLLPREIRGAYDRAG